MFVALTEDRHVLGCRRTGFPCVRCHCSFRAEVDLGKDERRRGHRKGKGQATWAATARHEEGRGRHQAGCGKNLTRRSRQAARARPLHDLSGDEAVGYQSHCLTKIPLCSPLALCVEGSRVEGIWFGHAAHLECSRVSGLWCSHSC